MPSQTPVESPFTLKVHVCVVCRTVLLMNPSEVPAEFLSVAEQLTCAQHSPKDTYITLIKHAFQSTLGTKYPLHHIHAALQVSLKIKLDEFLFHFDSNGSFQPAGVKCAAVRFSRRAANTVQVRPADELGEIFSEVSDVLEAAAALSSPSKGRGHVIQELEQLRERLKIPASNGRKSDGEWAGLTLVGRDSVFCRLTVELVLFQVCSKLCRCPQPSATRSTGRRTISVV